MAWERNTKIMYTPRDSLGSKRKFVKYFFIFIFFAFFAGGILYGGYRILTEKKFFISHILIDGEKDIPEDTIREIVQTYFQEKIFMNEFLVTRQHYLLASEETIKNRLQNAFSDMEEVTVAKKFPDILSILIQERNIWGTVCVVSNESIAKKKSPYTQGVQDETQCFYIDSSGVAFRPAPFFIGALTRKIFIVGESVILGKLAVSKEIISFYEASQNLYKELSLFMTSLELPSATSRDMFVFFKDWYIILDRDIDIGKLREIVKPLFRDELKGRLHQLEYVDLRFGNKVFYKFKN